MTSSQLVPWYRGPAIPGFIDLTLFAHRRARCFFLSKSSTSFILTTFPPAKRPIGRRVVNLLAETSLYVYMESAPIGLHFSVYEYAEENFSFGRTRCKGCK